MERMGLTSLLAGSVSIFSAVQYLRRPGSSKLPFKVAANAKRAIRCAAARRFAHGEIAISSNFDSGNIEVIDASDPKNIQLHIQKDPFTHGTDKKHHFQWFYFRVSNVKGKDCTYRITNSHEASYAEAWKGYKVAYSYDPASASPDWLRVANTDYAATTEAPNNEELSWTFTSDRDTVWFAYFAPFSYERHQSLVATVAASGVAETRVLGHSLGGKPIDLVKLGTGPKKVWVIARQHPGESMAEWWMQGFLNRLTGSEAKVRDFLASATLYVVPNMNPDGSAMGNLRTNAAGANLNREWQSGVYEGYSAPSQERSPEVLCVLEEMKKTGVDLFIDVHGDEEIPDNFFAGGQGIPSWDSRQEALYVLLNYFCLKATKDFQVGRGYGLGDDPDFQCVNSKKGEANLSVASNHVGNRFNCLAATLEMPFKDTTNTADAKCGWSPERSQALGASMVTAFAELVPYLRGPLGEEGEGLVAKAKEETKAKGSNWYKESV